MKRFGLIDIGSNTVRLVLFKYHEDTGLKEIQNIKTPARLAQYVNDDDEMSSEGIERLEEILKSYKKVSERFGINEVYPIATAAIRASKNVEQIKSVVKNEVGIDMIVITGEEEAYYGYNAVTHTISNLDAVTIDIGGASCEITFFEDKRIIDSISLNFGVVTLNRLFFKGKDHNDKDAIKAAEKYVKEELSKLRWLLKLKVPIIAIGGSARNVARIHQSMNNYPIAGVHGYSLDQEGLDQVYEKLVGTDKSDLDDVDGLSKERSDIILPSVIVFKTLFEVVEASEFKFSRKGIREGYAIDVINAEYPKAFSKFNIFSNALIEIGNDFQINQEVGNQRIYLASKLYHELYRLGYIEINKHEKHLMKCAAYLFDLGNFIDRDSASQHTYYLLSNSNIDGIVHKDRVKLALLASYKNKSLLKFFSEETGWFSDDELEQLQSLGGLLKFANALNISKTGIVKELLLDDSDKDDIVLYIKYEGDSIAEEYQANRQKKHFERILDEKVTLKFTEI